MVQKCAFRIKFRVKIVKIRPEMVIFMYNTARIIQNTYYTLYNHQYHCISHLRSRVCEEGSESWAPAIGIYHIFSIEDP